MTRKTEKLFILRLLMEKGLSQANGNKEAQGQGMKIEKDIEKTKNEI